MADIARTDAMRGAVGCLARPGGTNGSQGPRCAVFGVFCPFGAAMDAKKVPTVSSHCGHWVRDLAQRCVVRAVQRHGVTVVDEVLGQVGVVHLPVGHATGVLDDVEHVDEPVGAHPTIAQVQ